MALTGWSATSYLRLNSSVVSGPPCSFACWVNYPVSPAPFDNVQFACWSTLDLSGTNVGLYLDSFNGSVVNCVAAEVNGGNAYPADTAFSTAACNLGVWQHIAATWRVSGSSTVITAYINGGNKGTKTYANIPSGLIQSVIGNDPRGSGVQSTGPIAVPTFWNTVLSDADIGLLSTGYLPSRLRTANITSSLPLASLVNPEPDLFYGTPWPVLGSGLAFAPDPPFLYGPPNSFSITCAITGVSWIGEPVWTVTTPWGFISRPSLMEAMQQVVWKAGAQYGGRMQAYFSRGTTNSTEVGVP